MESWIDMRRRVRVTVLGANVPGNVGDKGRDPYPYEQFAGG